MNFHNLLAQAQPPVPESFALWVVRCLGLFGFLALLIGVVIFVGACFVVARARRPAVIASYLVFLVLPLLLATLQVLKGNVASFSVLARTGAELTQSQINSGVAQSLLLPFVALTVTLPSYLVIAVGLFIRTLRADKQPTTHGRTAESPLGIAAPAKEPNKP